MRRRDAKTRLTSANGRRSPSPPPRVHPRPGARRRRSRSDTTCAVEVDQRAIELVRERRCERVPVERRWHDDVRLGIATPHDLHEPADAASDAFVVHEVDVVRAEEDDDCIDRRVRKAARQRYGRPFRPSESARSYVAVRPSRPSAITSNSSPSRRCSWFGQRTSRGKRSPSSRARSPTCWSCRSRRALHRRRRIAFKSWSRISSARASSSSTSSCSAWMYRPASTSYRPVANFRTSSGASSGGVHGASAGNDASSPSARALG